jgi:hypothetical protein
LNLNFAVGVQNMKNKSLTFIIFLITFGINLSCNSVKSQNEIAENISKKSMTPQPNIVSASPSNIDVKLLCDKLSELKKIPYDPNDVNDDPIYNGLIKQGNNAIPCLINKITDITLMPDPREAPQVEKFRVGDAAVFILLFITKQDWQPKTMLSPEFAKYWKSDGVYAYFAYVEKPANRKKMQIWWKNWMKDNINK